MPKRRLRIPLLPAACLAAALLSASGLRAEAPKPVSESERSAAPESGQGAERIAAGERVFRLYCMGCHGFSGRGDGPTALALELPTPSFRKANFRWDTDGDGRPGTDADLRNVITHGVRGFEPACETRPELEPLVCQMQPWGETLGAEQIGDVIVYIRSLERRERDRPGSSGR